MIAARAGSDEPCSAIARALHEPLYGTVPKASGWILLEHPAPWGPKALEESGLDPDVASEIGRRSSQLGLRVLLIRRRPGRYRPQSLSCFLVWSDRSRPWIESVALDHAGDLLRLDLSRISRPEPAGLGTRIAHPIYLVCTHGRRDPCCAERGRRLINSLSDHGDRVWESSHQGGHRFAANLACFPEAIFYGRVGPASGEDIVRRHAERAVVLDHLRGRSTDDAVVQAADFLVRREKGFELIDELHPIKATHVEDGNLVDVEFDHSSGRLTARLEITKASPRPTSCRSSLLESPDYYNLVEISQ